LQIKDEILNETILCFVWFVLDNAGFEKNEWDIIKIYL
jgi:hypothetical protein